jgi:hypothetical protein
MRELSVHFAMRLYLLRALLGYITRLELSGGDDSFGLIVWWEQRND